MTLQLDPSTSQFVQANALYLAHASRIAYLDDPVSEARDLLGINVQVFNDHLINTQGFAGSNDDYGVLAFRGTEPNQISDWVNRALVEWFASCRARANLVCLLLR